VKWRVLTKHFFTGGICVETGTYMGETTAFLGRNFSMVFSLEPSVLLHELARKRFLKRKNIFLINESSEDGFEEILRPISGNVNFWLDGHFSGKGTFKGNDVTPIELELTLNKKYLKNLKNVSIAVDDFRLFNSERKGGYPSPKFLVDFANENGFEWAVERDIFLMHFIKP
jgi:hypothetical protein